MTRLTTLDLSDNLLQSGSSDDDAESNDGGRGIQFPEDVFPELVELDLSGGRLSSVSAGMFGNLRRLARLRLSNNVRLTEIEPESFAELSGLVRLELDGCRRLTRLRAGSLTGLTSLRVLTIRDSGLVHIHHSVFVRLEHLEELVLRNNRLGEQVRGMHGDVRLSFIVQGLHDAELCFSFFFTENHSISRRTYLLKREKCGQLGALISYAKRRGSPKSVIAFIDDHSSSYLLFPS